MKRLIKASRATIAIGLAALALSGGTAHAAGAGPAIPQQDWSFEGFFGKFDQMQLQRGWQVFNENCSACHDLKYMSYRNLADLGSNEAEIKAFANERETFAGPDEDGSIFNEDGDAVRTRPAIASDAIVGPYANDNEARSANGGALPPNLSLIIKARSGGLDPVYSANGADYVYALLTGYEDPPADFDLGDGMNYNKYYSGHQIAMAQPLYGDDVEYADGTEATVEQHAKDVAAFLTWAAEPDLAERKQMGLKVVIFLIAMTILFYAAKRRVWSDVH